MTKGQPGEGYFLTALNLPTSEFFTTLTTLSGKEKKKNK